MADTLEPLILDLVEWVAKEPRSPADVLDAWRTSCPRLPVWEEAVERGLVAQSVVAEHGAVVSATGSGLAWLRENGRLPAPRG